MNYTLEEIRDKAEVFSDKMGSDYFTLPVFLSAFETSALGFIGLRLKQVEKTQEITDDIRNLVVPKKIPVIVDTNNLSRYIAPVPVDYIRLLSYDVIYQDGSICRQANLLRQSEKKHALNNPSEKPNKKYPIITQENELWEVDSGSTVPAFLKIYYGKKPSIASTNELTKRIINLPDDVIEKILLNTLKLLYGFTADERTALYDKFEKEYRKVFE